MGKGWAPASGGHGNTGTTKPSPGESLEEEPKSSSSQKGLMELAPVPSVPTPQSGQKRIPTVLDLHSWPEYQRALNDPISQLNSTAIVILLSSCSSCEDEKNKIRDTVQSRTGAALYRGLSFLFVHPKAVKEFLKKPPFTTLQTKPDANQNALIAFKRTSKGFDLLEEKGTTDALSWAKSLVE